MKNPQAYPGQDGIGEHAVMNTGMTLLDHFAGLAMQAEIGTGDGGHIDDIAERAYLQAERMLKARIKMIEAMKNEPIEE